jgi:hypothetical protein
VVCGVAGACPQGVHSSPQAPKTRPHTHIHTHTHTQRAARQAEPGEHTRAHTCTAGALSPGTPRAPRSAARR